MLIKRVTSRKQEWKTKTKKKITKVIPENEVKCRSSTLYK
jgi:hypothetical protein